jgi:hypothetical protein
MEVLFAWEQQKKRRTPRRSGADHGPDDESLQSLVRQP